MVYLSLFFLSVLERNGFADGSDKFIFLSVLERNGFEELIFIFHLLSLDFTVTYTGGGLNYLTRAHVIEKRRDTVLSVSTYI